MNMIIKQSGQFVRLIAKTELCQVQSLLSCTNHSTLRTPVTGLSPLWLSSSTFGTEGDTEGVLRWGKFQRSRRERENASEENNAGTKGDLTEARRLQERPRGSLVSP